MPRAGADAHVPASLFEEVWLEGRLEDHLDLVYRDGARSARLLTASHAAAPTYTQLAVARAAGRVNRATGRGGGSTAPGRMLLRMAPGSIAALAARLAAGSTLISATNGKTTTARMLASILHEDGRSVVHNRTGANTHWGIATALAEARGESGVFEVDEAWLPLIAVEMRPRLVVLGNLFRDRLDGYGELERLIGLWRGVLSGSAAPPMLVANSDDPLISGAGGVLGAGSPRALQFGIDDRSVGVDAPGHPHEGRTCLRCGRPLRYSRAFVGHLGHYACPHCRVTRTRPAVSALVVHERGVDQVDVTIALPRARLEVRLASGGLHSVYNALAAAAAAVQLGVDPQTIRTGLEAARPAFGRGERLELDGRSIHLLLVKNPVGVNETLRLLSAKAQRAPLHVWFALNDGEADGRDVSWIWDADFESLRGAVGAATCSGRRAAALALRLKYAGWTCPIDVDEQLGASFEHALACSTDSLFMLPTYSALLGLRAVLNRRGLRLTDWGDAARVAV